MLKLFLLFYFIFTFYPVSRADKPFHGQLEGSVTNVGENRKVFSGAGSNNIMGNVTVEMDYYITYETQFNGGCSGGVAVSRDADGNEMHATVESGTWYVNFMTSTPEVIFEVYAVLSGGTGKYKNAKGKITGTGRQLYLPGTPTTFEWSGTVSY